MYTTKFALVHRLLVYTSYINVRNVFRLKKIISELSLVEGLRYFRGIKNSKWMS